MAQRPHTTTGKSGSSSSTVGAVRLLGRGEAVFSPVLRRTGSPEPVRR
jgi:hypothetical protein